MSALAFVPVILPESWGGFATNRGVLRFDGQDLVIEAKDRASADGVAGRPDSDTATS